MITVFGNDGNSAFALPMEQAYPDNPQTSKQGLFWDPVLQCLYYSAVQVDRATGDVTLAGDLRVSSGMGFYVNGLQVVSNRDTGWAASTGTPLKVTYDTATVTLPQLAGQVMALKTALITHGLIGA